MMLFLLNLFLVVIIVLLFKISQQLEEINELLLEDYFEEDFYDG